MIGLPPFAARHLQLELLDACAFPLIRLYKHARAGGPGGEWEPPPEAYRNLRVDPPNGHKEVFSVLYSSDTLPCVAAECRILQYDVRNDVYRVDRVLQKDYHVARYIFGGPALFVNIDGVHGEALGLAPRALGPRVNLKKPYEPYQAASLALFQRFGELAHGISWQSKHREQLGRVYAIWHHRKGSLQLALDTAHSFVALGDDADWLAFEMENSGLDDVQKGGLGP